MSIPTRLRLLIGAAVTAAAIALGGGSALGAEPTTAAPPGCPFTVPDCIDKVPGVATCDPDVDPNCPPVPPPPPPGGGPPPVPVPCTSPYDPTCHIWPDPVNATKSCAKTELQFGQCQQIHVGVTGKQVGPASTPTVDVYEPIPPL